tara:strand:+ start:365 stop:829 length:465 start_codon:yes stop_codon:yes gene_type:complete
MSFIFLLLVLTTPAANAGHSFLMRDINGKVVNLDKHKDKIIMLNFWATWCAPCMAEMPHLQKIQHKYKDELLLIAVSVDEARDKSKIKPYIKSRGYDFTVVHDDDRSLMAFYNPTMELPYNVIINHNREIVYQSAGYQPGKELVFNKILKSIVK